jgi:ketosteroid isomerase-like protein
MHRKTLLILLGVLLAAVTLVGCAQYPASAAETAKDDRFLEVVWEYENAWQANDVDATIAYYAEDAISLLPGLEMIEGKENIEADMRLFLDMYELEREFELVDYTVAGTYATRLGEWTNTMTPKDGGDVIADRGRCIVGFEKIDGEWKVVWEIMNIIESTIVQSE